MEVEQLKPGDIVRFVKIDTGEGGIHIETERQLMDMVALIDEVTLRLDSDKNECRLKFHDDDDYDGSYKNGYYFAWQVEKVTAEEAMLWKLQN